MKQEPFATVWFLFVYVGDAIVGTFFHANRDAVVIKQADLETMALGYSFKVVEYALKESQ